MNWREIINLRITDDWGLDFGVGPIGLAFLAAAAVLFVLPYLWNLRTMLRRFEPIEVEVKLGGFGKVTLKPNDQVIQIAHGAWVELATRKAGLPIEPEDDVIEEIYNSWYELFGRMRHLASSCPADSLARDDSTKIAVKLIVDAMNYGLRPHLTRWQARFRRWYKAALEEPSNQALSPQEVQRKFPEYDELMADLLKVNGELIEYKNLLRQIARREKTKA